MKNIKNINKAILGCVFVGFSLLISCSGDLDINKDPLAATEVDASLLMPHAIINISQQRTIELLGTNFHSQQWVSGGSAGVFTAPERYTISSNTISNSWSGFYTSSLRNLRAIRTLTEKNNPAARNIIGQARILEAFNLYNLTQVFGEIPATQATNPEEFPNPKFDEQSVVFDEIIKRIDIGLQELSTSTQIIQSSDLIYNGNRDYWIRFGNSLKLATLMLIANKNPSPEVIAKIKLVSDQPLIDANVKNAYFRYKTATGNENPIWKLLNLFSGDLNEFLFAGSTLVDLMNANNDPRRYTYFDQVGGSFVGQKPGVLDDTGISRVSLKIIRKDLEDRYFTASQTYFLLSEAAVKGWITKDSQTLYQQAIKLSLDSYDGQPGAISISDKNTYMLSSRGSIMGLSQTDALKRIYEESYVSLFTQGIESWTLWRKTKMPVLIMPVGATIPNFIRRYTYPSSEQVSNKNAPAQKSFDTAMWFEN